LDGVPTNTTVECDAVPAPATVTAYDNCDNDVPVTFSQTATAGCPYTITRTWTATDDCGNTTTATQTILVIDTEAPVLVGVPANSTIQCGEIPAPAAVTATDNCDTNVEITVNDVVVSEGCPYTVVRTWTATDNCNNQTSASQTFIVDDTVNPYVVNGVPSELTIECNTPEPYYLPTFGDNCDTDLTIVAISGIANVTPCSYDVQRAWTATDNCGNSVTVTQTIHVVDTTAPTFNNAPDNVTVECTNVPAVAMVTASDNCHTASISFTETMTAGCPYTITRTWVANDGCGNYATHVQLITVIDNVDPVLVGVPANTTAECSNIPAPAVVTATDNCTQNIVVEYYQTVLEGSGCSYIIERHWSATDNCGNTVSATQSINVIDTTAPVLSGQNGEITVECNVSPSIIAPTATDNCDTDVTIVPSMITIPGDCPNAWTEVYTWTAYDNCQNSAVRTIIVHYQDTTAPVLSGVPANTTAECNAVPNAPIVTADDNCDDDVTVNFSETATVGCPHTITRTWTVTDDCGNTTTATQTILVVDTTEPTVTNGIPTELTIECNTIVPQYTPGFADNCDSNLELSSTEEITNVNNCGYDIVRTWSATDNCGNTTTVSQTIHVVDTTNPTLVGVPANATVECDNIPNVPLVFGTDNCDDNVAVSFSQVSDMGCPYTITRTWTATDDCGNTYSASQILLVVDTTAPTLVQGVPAELTIECSDDQPVYQPIFADNCDDDLTYEAISGYNNVTPCSYDIEITWTATDNCGNSASVSQVIHVIDTTNPVLSGTNSEITVECNVSPSIVAPTATDNCDSDVNVVLDITTIAGNCANSWTEVYTWTAYDNCNNTAVRTFTIHYIDTTAPELSNTPDDLVIECGDAIPAPAAVMATDNCDEDVTVSLVETETALDCGYVITRTWTATDNCNNSTVYTQYIYVLDETSPELYGVPADITIECNTPIPAPAQTWATDNCDDNVSITTTDIIIPQDCYYEIKRDYVATDDCGNTTTIVQIITVVDTTDPIVVAPADVTVNCENIPAPAELEGTDNCDTDVLVTYTESTGEGCPYTIVRTWTATDNCGNQSSDTQIVTVIDEVAPIFNAFPAYIEIECDQVAAYTVTAYDNCDNDVEIIVYSELPVSGACYGNLLRQYLAIDNCGNETLSDVQIIDIVDNTAPVLAGVPADITIECGNDLPAVANVTATDNCTEDLVVQYVQTQTNQFCPYDIIRTWSVIDQCGNVTVDQQVIHVTVTVPGQITLLAYPNPADDMFTVRFSMPTDKAVKGGVYDVTGRMVVNIIDSNADGGRLYEWKIDATTFRAGAYMITMQVGDELLRQKLIVNGGK
jgi:hypothetical protein